MRLLFIRHARAIPAAEYNGDDLKRPLKKKGILRAKKAFLGVKRLFPTLEIIYTSKAVRATQTASILSGVYDNLAVEEVDLLNPGAELPEFLRFLQAVSSQHGTIAIVGHEPDFSEIISGLLQHHSGTDHEEHTALGLDVKKASCIELTGSGTSWVLESLLPPRVLRRIGK